MSQSQSPAQRVGLLRILAAQVYDLLLLVGLWVCASALAVASVALIQGPERFESDNPLMDQPLYWLYLLAIPLVFFVGFWTHGGQTLGMRAWQIRLRRRSGDAVSPWRALLRLVGAALSWLACGLGYWWMLVDAQGLSWHDRLSDTHLERHRRR